MDSKIVSRELWKVVRPLLRDAGWTSFSSRTAQRFSNPRIDVVNFQSFNSYLASAIGSTTYSFSVRLGCFFTAIPHSGIKLKDGLLMPEEYHCHLRCTIRKKFSQPECPRTDVFYLDPKGDYLPTVVEATRQGIATKGLAWFRRFSEMEEVLRKPEYVWGCGVFAVGSGLFVLITLRGCIYCELTANRLPHFGGLVLALRLIICLFGGWLFGSITAPQNEVSDFPLR